LLSNSIHNPSDLYILKNVYGYSLHSLVCSIWYELIWLVNCNNLHIDMFDSKHCFWLSSPFHLRCIVNLNHTLISLLVVAAAFLTFLHPRCFLFTINNAGILYVYNEQFLQHVYSLIGYWNVSQMCTQLRFLNESKQGDVLELSM